jgi:hypothetical protein
MGQKPHDIFGVSLCRNHHGEQHNLGVEPLTANTRLICGLWEFARRSPDAEMGGALKPVRAEELAEAGLPPR